MGIYDMTDEQALNQPKGDSQICSFFFSSFLNSFLLVEANDADRKVQKRWIKESGECKVKELKGIINAVLNERGT